MLSFRRPLLVVATALLFAAPAAIARDNAMHLPLAEVIAQGRASGELDGSVEFYLQGAKTPAVQQALGAASVNRKTNAFNKGDEEACQWVTLGALQALQQAAKRRGANAVIGMVSNYKNRPWTHASQYECHAGGIMAGVAFKGTYARVGR
jgi:uncharacterized protein YbjQ (UPF0145 family)